MAAIHQCKMEEAQGIFGRLTDADRSMVTFVTDKFINRLDQFINKVEQAVNAGDLNVAESQRLDFKRDSKEMVELLERFNSDFSGLVIDFADIAKVPISLTAN